MYLIYTTQSPWTGWTFSNGNNAGSADQYNSYLYETNLPSPSPSPTPDAPYILINTPKKAGTLRYWETVWNKMDNYIPTSLSTDGTYMLVDTVSNGTSTKSWETVPSGGGGGGATYTAGTGIDIDANNEISVDATDLSYNDLQDKPTIPTVPTNISAFTNDAGYLTSHQSLVGYATQNYVDNALSQVPSYSAGTGISIDANGVISLALANAS
jgi:hypothetical protein